MDRSSQVRIPFRRRVASRNKSDWDVFLDSIEVLDFQEGVCNDYLILEERRSTTAEVKPEEELVNETF